MRAHCAGGWFWQGSARNDKAGALGRRPDALSSQKDMDCVDLFATQGINE